MYVDILAFEKLCERCLAPLNFYVGKCKAIIMEYEILILYYWNKNKDVSAKGLKGSDPIKIL